MQQWKLIAFALFAILAIGCSRGTKHASGMLTLNNGAEPEYLDPSLAADSSSIHIIENLFEGLTALDPKDLHPVPGVAEKWEVSPDGKTYTFTLRQNAKWSDGSPVTAHDFVASWRRVVNPVTASGYASMLYPIVNARGINQGKISDLSQLGVEAIDDFHLRVRIENPMPLFPAVVAFATYKPVKMSVVDKFGEKWTRPENMVSNGPFKLQEWTPQKRIVIVPNEQYWDRDKVKLKQAVFLPIEDQETALKLFLAGDIQFLYDLPALKIPTLEKNPDFVRAPFLAQYYIIFNVKRPPFDNPRVRQALASSIDREQLVKVINKGIPSSSLTPAGITGYMPPQGWNFDLEKARALLAEAGYTGGAGFPKTPLLYNTSQSHRTIMEVVQNMWKQNLGIDIAPENMEWKVLLKTKANHDFSMTRFGWIGDYLDPSTFLLLFTSDDSNNDTQWANARYDELMHAAVAEADQARRLQLYAEAEKIALEEAPAIPLYTYTQEMLISKRVKGIYPNLLQQFPLKNVSVE